MSFIRIVKSSSNLRAGIQLPASKSISNRILMLNALSCLPQAINNLSDCDDTMVMQKALDSKEEVIDIHAAGTAMRFLTAYFSGKSGSRIITGTERMRNRPIHILVDALRAVGAQIEYMEKEGFPPLKITGGKLRGGEVTLDGSVSSQYISALLMEAPSMENGLTLHLSGSLISKPYLHLTIELMRQFGVSVEEAGQTYKVAPQKYRAEPFTVESDWSAASYWYEMVALSPDAAEIELKGLFKDSLQGDAAIVPLFERLGVQTVFTDSGVKLSKHDGKLPTHFEYDCVNIPDMAQTLVVTCAMLGVPFVFNGLQSLKIKETDRLRALKVELEKLGYRLQEQDGRVLAWDGIKHLPEEQPEIATYDDHRMAMAFAPVALRLEAGIVIANPEVVSKSYPHFWDDLRGAGFQLCEFEKDGRMPAEGRKSHNVH